MNNFTAFPARLFLVFMFLLAASIVNSEENIYVISLANAEQVSENELHVDLLLSNNGASFFIDHVEVVIGFNPAITGEGFFDSDAGLQVIAGSSQLIYFPVSTNFIVEDDDSFRFDTPQPGEGDLVQEVGSGSTLRLARLKVIVHYEDMRGVFDNIPPGFMFDADDSRLFVCDVDDDNRKSGPAMLLEGGAFHNATGNRPLAGHYYSGNGYWHGDDGIKHPQWNAHEETHSNFAHQLPHEHANAIIGGRVSIAHNQAVTLTADNNGNGGHLYIQNAQPGIYNLELKANGAGVNVMLLDSAYNILPNPAKITQGEKFSIYTICLWGDETCGSFINWTDQNNEIIEGGEFNGPFTMPASDMVITANWTSGTTSQPLYHDASACIAAGAPTTFSPDTPLADVFLPSSKHRDLSSQLVIEPGASLTVDILHNDHDAGAEAIVLQSLDGSDVAGSLIHMNDGVLATVERYIDRWLPDSPQHGWHFIASPVQDMDIRPEFVPYMPDGTVPPWVDFYKWDEALVDELDGEEVAGWWVNSKRPGNTWNPDFEDVFVTGRGYLLAYGEPGSKDAGDRVHRFSGVMEVGDVTHGGLSHTEPGEYAGWHLIGNPFASALDWTKGSWQRQNILGGPVIWHEANASYTPVIDIIPAMNGFMIKTSGGGSLTIPADARTHHASGWYKSPVADNAYACSSREPGKQHAGSVLPYPTPKSTPDAMAHIRLTAYCPDRQTAQESVILFRPEATNGYDPLYDTRFKEGHAPQFYSLSDNKPLLLNNRPDPGEAQTIPLAFLPERTSTYYIALSNQPEDVRLYLEDPLERQIHTLSDNKAYSFSQSGGQMRNFLLHINPGEVSEPNAGADEDSALDSWSWQKTLYVRTESNRTCVRLYNIRGQLLHHVSLNGQGLHSMELPGLSGVFVVRLQADGLLVVRRVSFEL